MSFWVRGNEFLGFGNEFHDFGNEFPHFGGNEFRPKRTKKSLNWHKPPFQFPIRQSQIRPSSSLVLQEQSSPGLNILIGMIGDQKPFCSTFGAI